MAEGNFPIFPFFSFKDSLILNDLRMTKEDIVEHPGEEIITSSYRQHVIGPSFNLYLLEW